MSGSTRAITLTLSVKDAESVQATLKSIGATGEEALKKLETAAQRTGSRGGGLPAVAAAADEAKTRFAGMGQAVQSAGFQLQDFFVQIQGGQSALTALSQQGSQFLGVFGTGGAIAGAVLAVGAFAAGMLGLGSATSAAARAAEDLKEAERIQTEGMKLSIELTETLTEKTKRLADERRGLALAGIANRQLEIDSLTRDTQRTIGRLGEPTLLENADPLGNFTPGSGRNPVSGLQEGGLRQTLLNLDKERADLEARAKLVQGLSDQAASGLTAPRAAGAGRAAREPGDPLAGFEELQQRISKAGQDVALSVDPAAAAFNRLTESLAKVNSAGNLFLQTGDREGGPLGLSPDRVREVTDLLQNQYIETLDKLDKKNTEVAVSGREIATVFTSAFDGMVTGSGKAGDAIKRLEQGIARLIERAFITKPLEQALSGLGNNLGLGGIFRDVFSGQPSATAPSAYSSSSSFQSNFASTGYAMANGGVMTSMGPLPLHTYAGGGVARSPQVAIFGEARRPEAYVPLPDGRSIPVSMSGGGSGATINIDARGADAGVEQRIDAVLARRLPSILAASEGNITAKVNRGGSLARTLGRRA